MIKNDITMGLDLLWAPGFLVWPLGFLLYRYYSVSIFCKIGAPGYVSSVVFGVVVNVASICGVLTIDKVMYIVE